ncbi:MAG: addiction module protein [Planctomycetota bacterium]
MTTNAVTLTPQITSMSDSAKDMLVTRLLKSVDEPSSEEIDELWYAEADERLQACLQGNMKLVPWTEILAESRNRKKR